LEKEVSFEAVLKTVSVGAEWRQGDRLFQRRYRYNYSSAFWCNTIKL